MDDFWLSILSKIGFYSLSIDISLVVQNGSFCCCSAVWIEGSTQYYYVEKNSCSSVSQNPGFRHNRVFVSPCLMCAGCIVLLQHVINALSSCNCSELINEHEMICIWCNLQVCSRITFDTLSKIVEQGCFLGWQLMTLNSGHGAHNKGAPIIHGKRSPLLISDSHTIVFVVHVSYQ